MLWEEDNQNLTRLSMSERDEPWNSC